MDSSLHVPNWLEECTQREGGEVTARVALGAVRQLLPVLGAQVQGRRLAVQLHQLDAGVSAGLSHFSHIPNPPQPPHSLPFIPVQTPVFGKKKMIMHDESAA